MRLDIEAGILSLTLLHILFGAHFLALCTHEMSSKKKAQNMHQSVTSTIDCKNVLFISLKKNNFMETCDPFKITFTFYKIPSSLVHWKLLLAPV